MTGRDDKLPSVLVLAQDGRTAPLRTLLAIHKSLTHFASTIPTHPEQLAPFAGNNKARALLTHLTSDSIVARKKTVTYDTTALTLLVL